MQGHCAAPNYARRTNVEEKMRPSPLRHFQFLIRIPNHFASADTWMTFYFYSDSVSLFYLRGFYIPCLVFAPCG
jgi:hypothetical protein